jgi:hypothetical protein
LLHHTIEVTKDGRHRGRPAHYQLVHERSSMSRVPSDNRRVFGSKHHGRDPPWNFRDFDLVAIHRRVVTAVTFESNTGSNLSLSMMEMRVHSGAVRFITNERCC